ncbi:P-loop containing nucleoside triphosphate hydrolase protein [Collybia nuda]|uniref:Kinesin-like protein n=1 Tax=Collybia nuda TaxID=64659 RepID=A0A9P5XYX7_9AGAR|nr:P-loop containing nucleoside triphosphate hydrolase protein [Collybia nuda]
MATAKVKIAARLRPRLQGELDDESVKIHHDSDGGQSSSSASGGGSFITVTNPRDPSQLFKFPFTSCYGQDSTQEEIFQNDVQPMIDVVYSGVTVTIFAYGVTSSGKTHTMQGTRSEPGVIPRVVKAMFDKKSNYSQYDVSLSVSYMEIYKDEVYDLLVTRENAPKLPVRENDVGMVFVANLTSEPIHSVEEFDILYSQATKHRSVGSTNLNRASSRSHAVLTIQVDMLDPAENRTLTGKINLVDLAGSENNKLTGNDPSRMAESSAINKSLSVLGQVVHALNQGASRIPYRNSKLTRILQDALGGSSVGLLICNLAPGVKFRQDTLNTLNFAVRTKNVENKPVVNERDNRPAPKPHFAAVAIQPPAGKPAPAILQHISTAGAGSGPGPTRSRASLVPVSRVPRVSAHGGNGYQPFALPGAAVGRRGFSEKIPESEVDRSGSIGVGLTEKDIDERISKAVEMEVARRLEEREREREKEEEARRSREQEQEVQRRSSESSRSKSRSPKKEQTLPSGVLTPLLKRHRDLDDELQNRLQELERKFERGNKELQLADVLSPASKKKTGRAYVALARAHSEKGDLQVALDLYRKAESYVPDNIKLKERIIEIEWSVKNNREFVPSPKPPKKAKTKKKAKSSKDQVLADGAPMDVDQDNEMKMAGPRRGAAMFGAELTNTDSPNGGSGKRPLEEEEDDDLAETPQKRQKRGGKTKVVVTIDDSDGDDWMPPAPPKKGKRKAVS